MQKSRKKKRSPNKDGLKIVIHSSIPLFLYGVTIVRKNVPLKDHVVQYVSINFSMGVSSLTNTSLKEWNIPKTYHAKDYI